MRYSELTQLNESSEYHVRIRTQKSSQEVITEISDLMKKCAAFGKQFITKDSSTPGGPDTTKFRASNWGGIAFHRDFQVGNSVYKSFLKIGTGLADRGDIKVWDMFKKEFTQYIGQKMGAMSTTFECPDGTVTVYPKHGTNWGGYGIHYSDYVYK